MRKRIFFICGSMNQTTQMHQVSEHLREYEHSFSPYYVHGFDEILRRLGLIEFTIAGNKAVGRCRTYLQNHGLLIDYQGRNGPYDLVVTCSDVYLQKNIRGNRIVLVQEGIIDPESMMFRLVKRLRFLPRWMADTGMTGLSDAYRAFCVASEGYRDFFIRRGARPEKLVVTGIPNFDDCAAILQQRLSLQALRAGLHVGAEGDIPARGPRGLHSKSCRDRRRAGSLSSSFTRAKMSNEPPGKSACMRLEPWCSRLAARKK